MINTAQITLLAAQLDHHQTQAEKAKTQLASPYFSEAGHTHLQKLRRFHLQAVALTLSRLQEIIK